MKKSMLKKIGDLYFLPIPIQLVNLYNLSEREFLIHSDKLNLYITLLKDIKVCFYANKIASDLDITYYEAEKEYIIPFHDLLISNELEIQIKAAKELLGKLKERYFFYPYGHAKHIDNFLLFSIFKSVLKGCTVENYSVILQIASEELSL